MTKDSYPALFHFLHKQLYDITYPAAKEEILRIAGERPVHTDWHTTVPLHTFVSGIKKESYSCAADFYCALIASMQASSEEHD